MKSLTKWLLGILVLLIIVFVGFFIFTHQPVKFAPEPPDKIPADLDLTNKSVPAGKNSTSQDVIYTNDKMGFSFSLPSDYYVIESYNYEGVFSVGLSIAQKEDGRQVLNSISTEVVVYQEKMTLDDLKKRLESIGGPIISSTQKKIDGKEAVQYELGGMIGGQEIDVVSGQFAMTINNESSLSPDESNKIISQIVSTFHFAK